MTRRTFAGCTLLIGAQLMCAIGYAQTPMSRDEQDVICPLVGEMALVATELRDKKFEKESANSEMLREFRINEKPEKMKKAVSTLAQGIVEVVYATPSLEASTEVAFNFASCVLNLYTDPRTNDRMPALIQKAEACQGESIETETRVKCVLRRFEEG
jgi:hypothetical protein